MSKLDLISGNYFFDAGDYSYRVYHNANGQYVVCCFVGTDKTKISHYLVLGVLNPETGEVQISAAGRFREEEMQVKTIRDLTRVLWTARADSDASGREDQVESLLNDKCAVDIIETARKARVAMHQSDDRMVTAQYVGNLSRERMILSFRWARRALSDAGYVLPDPE